MDRDDEGVMLGLGGLEERRLGIANPIMLRLSYSYFRAVNSAHDQQCVRFIIH